MNTPLESGAPYRSICVPFDNSDDALRAGEIAIAIAQRTGACVTGSHVCAAALHDRRFRQMEGGLPPPYRAEQKLVEQREIHDDLITRGLQTVCDSYLDVLGAECERAGVVFQRTSLEGRHWKELVRDIGASGHDLVVMGATGLGAAGASSPLGSVCERVARRIARDLVVVKAGVDARAGPIVAAIDGSAQGFAALRQALSLGRLLDRPVEAIAVFDPLFHHVAFRRIAGVLSEEAARTFRFEQQERLHEDIIDSGLAKIYRDHLDVAARIAAGEGAALRTALLSGKAFERILAYASERQAWLLALGRTGAHAEPESDLGSTSEKVLRIAGCHVMLAAGSYAPPARYLAEAGVAWTDEAQARMARVPERVRRMARQAVVAHAVKHGYSVVTCGVIEACLDAMAPRDAAGKCPFEHRAPRAGTA